MDGKNRISAAQKGGCVVSLSLTPRFIGVGFGRPGLVNRFQWFQGIEVALGQSQGQSRLGALAAPANDLDFKWIAEELGVGSWKDLPNLLNQERHTANQPEFAQNVKCI